MKKLVQVYHHVEGDVFPGGAYITLGKRKNGFCIVFRWYFLQKLKKGLICPVTFKRIDTVCYPAWVFFGGKTGNDKRFYYGSALWWVPVGQYTIESVE